jgi:hypothetical protein
LRDLEEGVVGCAGREMISSVVRAKGGCSPKVQYT